MPGSRPESAPAVQSQPGQTAASGGAKKKEAKGVPAYLKPPMAKQINRTQAINGKLLEDNTMVRVLRGASSNDIVYHPNYDSQSHSRNLGAVRRFGDMIGRVPENKVGTRTAAQGSFPSHWRPTAPPKDAITRPASASSGVAFQRQITRKQDVNGKLLENIAMTRFLFGSNGSGPEYYDRAYDSMMAPLGVSHRKKIGSGQHIFRKQVGRIPLTRQGTRSAADGTYPSHWEPGMGYSETIPKATKVADFRRSAGRVELHLSGMRGAPPKASLAADYVGSDRPQSAMAMLRGGDAGMPKRRAASADPGRPIPEGPKKHIECHSFAKQLTRDQWTNRPIRIAG
jgi:hypothetical protein